MITKITTIFFLVLCKCGFSQANERSYFDYATIEYTSNRRDRVEGTMHLTFDKKYAVAEDDENHNYIISEKTFNFLSDLMIKNTTCFIEPKIARRKNASFKITLYKNKAIFIEYFVFEKMGYNYFQKLAIELKPTDTYLSSVFESLINSNVFSHYSK
jgi:hypothetical protein